MAKKKLKIEKFSIERQILSTFNELIYQLPFMKGLVEVDITEARNIMKEYSEKTKNKVSFTGWVIKAISKAIMENEGIHAYRISKRKLVIPEDVNFGIMIERKTHDGKKVPSMEIIKSAESKSVLEITNEIRELQRKIISEEELLMGEQNFTRKLQYFLFAILPDCISRRLLKRIVLDKKYITKFCGTVGVTALGMFGKNASGHVIHFPTRTIDLALGTITAKPRYIDDKLVKREILNMTFYIDHNIVDGAPAARFVSRAIELLETAYGLEELK
ncbi:MAG: 2-oxo acid dehydrogenase subunit E2 [Candidatus Heimdallarchaeota archaeon]|nr:2-oxo acid dehydrogenase subunit E2 [Candidatus Heimdallarchaeota archaeon]